LLGRQNWTASYEAHWLLLLVAIFQPGFFACAQDHGRIKKKPPTPVEAERLASDIVMNDGSLHKGRHRKH
jgi:hypothetical protein